MQNGLEILKNIDGFYWDKHNINKNWLKHGVKFTESEETFFNGPLFIVTDAKHSQKENRWYALGTTDKNRKLFTVFTVRHQKIRVISSRNMSQKERKKYEELKKNPKI